MTIHEIGAEARAQITEIALLEASKYLAAGGLAVDVREPGEYAASRLESAINLPRDVIEFKIANHPLLACKDAPILL